VRSGNLLESCGNAGDAESALTLAARAGVRIERIVSRGHASPPGFWYDQDEHEYVLLVQGAAELEVEPGRSVRLGPGDWLDIPAHARHRVVWTDPDADTIWLAVFYRAV